MHRPLGGLAICALTGSPGRSEAVNPLVEPEAVIFVVGGEGKQGSSWGVGCRW